ncbi:hypothetical protein COT23_02860 [Candidatus Kaiserbacteria bacterium CG08_land_8_20_14_0_20_50_21]|uniref:Uncharacterized protein n=2 Tax=Candidatus Kaiseribacteriota TaxID=1752734 RepID=A0A2H0YXD8_9BACT|nr:MAG: hypothetical protein COT23_02860 [Candidatus Kaiserbacteria bacterium CG08_land_8_20_14_0_20_50_21]
MSTKVISFFVLAGIIVVCAWYFLLRTPSSNHIPITTNISPSKLIFQSGWETYENTAFKYRVWYPNSMSVGPLDQYNYITPITEQNQIIIIKDDLAPYSYNNLSYVVIKITSLKGLGIEEKKLINQDLKSFAEAKRVSLLNGVDPTIKIQAGKLQKMNFASSSAYFFDLSDDFELATAGSGYPPPGISNRYVFFENSNKDKFVIWYPLNDNLSQEIVNTFEFTDL